MYYSRTVHIEYRIEKLLLKFVKQTYILCNLKYMFVNKYHRSDDRFLK